jgi:hypothetical protein
MTTSLLPFAELVKSYVGTDALEALRKVTLHEGDFTAEQTFADFDMWPADLLHLEFELQRAFHFNPVDEALINQLKNLGSKVMDKISVMDYLRWVAKKVETK